MRLRLPRSGDAAQLNNESRRIAAKPPAGSRLNGDAAGSSAIAASIFRMQPPTNLTAESGLGVRLTKTIMTPTPCMTVENRTAMLDLLISADFGLLQTRPA